MLGCKTATVKPEAVSSLIDPAYRNEQIGADGDAFYRPHNINTFMTLIGARL